MRPSLFRIVSKGLTTDYAISLRRLCTSKSEAIPRQQASTSMENFEERAKKFFIFEQIEPDVFRTSNLSTIRQGSTKAAYGGLIFAQALATAESTVQEKFKPHAMHSFFILNVDTSIPVQYHVRRVRDGRSFCTRTVEAVQEGRIAFTLQVSFHVIEPDAAVHQDTMPVVPSWKESKCMSDTIPWLKEEIAAGRLKVNPAVHRRIHFYESRANQKNGDLFQVSIDERGLSPARRIFNTITTYGKLRPTDIDRHIGIGKRSTSRTFYTWFRSVGDLGDCEKLHSKRSERRIFVNKLQCDSISCGLQYGCDHGWIGLSPSLSVEAERSLRANFGAKMGH
ncbi:putative acyl-CoA thioesterase II [Necator americanus]|uniref:Putative acyl-CoA thioesterase II n=1 Tax=Necator americanus TaxID=51031 RepID=W2T9P4_NECAM|nr:putative acyl-CoA thioesterase II [Necator americanus]ETN78294.1 putative acyl-CoA thioesterase II [Necator americanus]